MSTIYRFVSEINNIQVQVNHTSVYLLKLNKRHQTSNRIFNFWPLKFVFTEFFIGPGCEWISYDRFWDAEKSVHFLPTNLQTWLTVCSLNRAETIFYMVDSRPLSAYFVFSRNFYTIKISDFSRIQTWIVRVVEDEHDDPLTTTTGRNRYFWKVVHPTVVCFSTDMQITQLAVTLL